MCAKNEMKEEENVRGHFCFVMQKHSSMEGENRCNAHEKPLISLKSKFADGGEKALRNNKRIIIVIIIMVIS